MNTQCRENQIIVCVFYHCAVFHSAPLGKRGWKMFYMTLRDMAMYLYNDEHNYKRATHCSNVVRVHHALATKAGDYVKKKHVFRLQTADLAQYLIQTRYH